MNGLNKGKQWIHATREDCFYFLALAFLLIVTAGTASVMVLTLNHNFLTVACDTALIQNGIVNTLQGQWFRDTIYAGPNILGIHSSFVILLLVPLYALFPSPDMLLVVQAVGIYSAIFPLYLLADAMLKRKAVAFALAVSLALNPLLFYMATASLHPETWILAAVLWSFYFYRANNAPGFWISALFACCCGEMAALIYVSMGAALLFVKDSAPHRKRYGKYALMVGFGWLFFTMFLLFPLMRVPGQSNVFAVHYANWDVKSPLGLILNVGKDPIKAISMLFDLHRWFNLIALMGIFLGAPFLSRQGVILLAPLPFYFLMCDQEFYILIHSYYFQFFLLAGCWAAIFFLDRLKKAWVRNVFLAAIILCNGIMTFKAVLYCQNLTTMADASFNNEVRWVMTSIPRQAGVYGPHRYSVYLSNRANMVMGDLREEHLDFDAMIEAKADITTVRPDQIEYIVCDTVSDQPDPINSEAESQNAKQRLANVNKLLQSGRWEVWWQRDDMYVLHRK